MNDHEHYRKLLEINRGHVAHLERQAQAVGGEINLSVGQAIQLKQCRSEVDKYCYLLGIPNETPKTLVYVVSVGLLDGTYVVHSVHATEISAVFASNSLALLISSNVRIDELPLE